MTQRVQLHARPPRTAGAPRRQPPPFRFEAPARCAAPARTARRGPLALVALLLSRVALLCGSILDAIVALAGITLWCAVHVALYSYAFDIGPAAACGGLPCPPWIAGRVLAACAVLAVVSYVASWLLARLGHRATSRVLLLLVTLDVAALIVLATTIAI